MDNVPYILDETNDFAVIFKPPKMHCVPRSIKNEPLTMDNEKREKNSVLEWFKENSTSVFDLVHRLDFETHGLVLIAKNEKSFIFLKSLQEKGEFIKEYSAKVISNDKTGSGDFLRDETLTGFPPPAVIVSAKPSAEKPLIIMSYFRPYGPGRKQVRPVIDIQKKHKEVAKDKGGFYRTEIIDINDNIFTMRIKRGFRHQIRCHLRWIGYPILNDPLYSNGVRDCTVSSGVNKINHHGGLLTDTLALRAHALSFTDPGNGKPRDYRISQI